MELSDYRSEIIVYIFNPDYTQAQAQAGVVSSVGYDVKFFPTTDLFFQACESEPPHMVLLDSDVLAKDVVQICEFILKVSNEILIFLLVSPKNVLNILQLISEQKAYDYVTLPMISSLDLVQKLDRGTERILIQYENEELRQEKEETSDLSNKEDDLKENEESSFSVRLFEHVFQFLQEVKFIRDKDIIIQRFLEKLSQSLNMVPIIFLKYLPNQMALGLKNSVFVPQANLQGLGVQLKGIPSNLIHRHLEHPQDLPQIHNLMKKVFEVKQFLSVPFQVDERVLGVFVLFRPISGEWERKLLSTMMDLLEMAYRSSELELRNHQLEIYDQSTKLLNKKHFIMRMEEEIDRAKRTSHPMSLILIEIDNEKELLDQLGERGFESLVIQIARILRKANRINDMVARFQNALFAIVLPHTFHMGAAVKAEKMRRMIEAVEFEILKEGTLRRVACSFGVTEYPTFGYDIDTLVRGADEAVDQVKTSGGNKVCLATAPIGYTPEYHPIKVQDRHQE